MVFPFPPFLFKGVSDIVSGGSTVQKSTSIRQDIGELGTGNIKMGGLFSTNQFSPTTQSFENIGNTSTVTNITNSAVEGFEIKQLPKTDFSPSTSTSQAIEKPLSFAPALVGGGTTTATGQAEASSGLDPTMLIILALAGVGAVIFLPKLKKGKKK